MKAISIYPQSVEIGGIAFPKIRLYADSAIGRDVMPLFVPDIPLAWSGRVCVAVRIVRLGKNIAPKFALRYVDAIGLVAVLAPDANDAAASAFIGSGGMQILDSAITTGHWQECDVSALGAITAEINGTAVTFNANDLAIARHVSDVSRLATLKTGDMIILESTAMPFDLRIGTTLKAAINSEPCLNLKIR